MSDGPSIADHGLIGDLRSAALVATDGTIDWFCPERFDADAVFAGILDSERGGSWAMAATDPDVRSTQFYFPDSNVLITRFMTDEGVVEVQDFMPIGEHQRIVRRLECVRGRMALRSRLSPAFGFGAEKHRTRRGGGGVVLATDALKLTLFASVDLETGGGEVSAEVDLKEGETETFVLHVGEVADREAHEPEPARRAFEETVGFWRDWLDSSTYTGRWREMVHRSALTLKLLTYGPTGAIVAAPTTSLPEEIGGDRNWDYRFTWMRDSAFTIYALLRLGFTNEADAFNAWTAERFRGCGVDGDDDAGPLQPMYRVDGSTDLAEREIEGLSGYRDSAPVRVGNEAVDQLQLDIYGELIDSIYLADKSGREIAHEDWEKLVGIVGWLCENWDRPDAGLWESRAGPTENTFSRLMSWVALERMIRVARRRGLPADLVAWTEARDEIYREIQERGWNEEIGAYVQNLDDGVLDASLLLMPMVKFCAAGDPRFVSTLEAIEKRLVSDTLVYRYDTEDSEDGMGGAEATFSICSFWYVEALTRVGRLEDARLALEKIFTYANHLGLYAEEISPSGEQLGNFPQAFTHFSLISAAYNLDRAMG